MDNPEGFSDNERIIQSETHVFKTVFPDKTNHHNTMFGGHIISMMTETAFMTATRFSRKNFVIVSIDQVSFKKPIPASSLIELIGRVSKKGHTSLHVQVQVYLEKINNDDRILAVEGNFILVAINDQHRPTSL